MQVKAPAVKTAPKPAAKVEATHSVPLDQIFRSQELVYRPTDPAHVDSLFNDIAVNGLDNPIITYAHSVGEMVKVKGKPDPVPATWLVAGSHRVEALKRFRREKPEKFEKMFPGAMIPSQHRIYTPQQALFALLRENIQRREMTAEEIFPVLGKLSGEPYNLKGKEIAIHIGKSPAWVSQMLAVDTQLDEETKSEVMAGEIAVGDARKLAAEVSSERKSGKEVSTKEIREKAATLKSKQATKVATGTQRATGDDRRVSAKKIWGRVQALPAGLGMGRTVLALKGAIEYLAQETDKLPAELRDDPKPSKVVPATPAKAKVAVKAPTKVAKK